MANEAVSKDLEDARLLKENGNKLLNLGQVSESIIEYSKAIILFPNLPKGELAILFSNRSLAYTVLQPANKEKALEDALQAISLSPDWWKGYTRAAQIYKSSEDFKNAIKFYSTASELNPGNEDIMNHLNVCLMRKAVQNINPKYLTRNVHECIETCVEAAVSKGENFEDAKKNLMTKDSELGYLVKGHIHRVGGKYKEAAEFFLKSSEKGNLEAKYNFVLLKINENYENCNILEIIHLLEEIAETKTTSMDKTDIGKAESEFMLGLYHQEVTKDYTKAMHYYERAKERRHGLAANNLGFMHSKGIGKLPDKEKAIKYWEFAGNSKHQVTQSMEMLAQHYLLTGDQLFSVAYYWFKKAVDCGNKRLLEKHHSFLADIDTIIKWKVRIDQLNVMRNEKESESLKTRLDSKVHEMVGLYFSPEDIEESFSKSVKIDADRNDKKGSSSGHTLLKTKPDSCLSGKEKLIAELENHLKLGMEWAKVLLDVDRHTTNALSILKTLEGTFSTQLATVFLKEMASAICLEETFLMMKREHSWIIKAIVDQMMSCTPVDEVSERDKNLLICEIYVAVIFDPKNLDRVLGLAQKAIKKYPEEFYFHDVKCMMYTHKQQREKAIQEINKTLKIFPNNYTLLYTKASVESGFKTEPYEKKINNFHEFINYAPVGHRFIPEAYYTIGFLLAKKLGDKCKANKNKNENRQTIKEHLLKDVTKYYELGKEKEKGLFSWYLPYKSANRDFLKTILGLPGL